MERVRQISEGVLVDLGTATALFSNKVSTGSGLSLDLARGSATRDAALDAILSAGRADDRVVCGMAQEHGAVVLTANALVGEPTCDGLISADSNLALLAVSADCVPVAIVQGDFVCVVHAGWRGLANGVIEAAVLALADAGSTGKMVAAVGPSARGCCYEVSTEVLESVGPRAVSKGRLLDTGATAEAILLASGASEVEVIDQCTVCGSPDRYFSYRAEGPDAGRQGVVAWLNR